MQIYTNLDGSGRGGPQVWTRRFRQLVERRGYRLTADLQAAWDAALFVVGSAGLASALQRGRPVGFRVANGYLPGWFQRMGRPMQPAHHAANAAIARALELAGVVIYQSQWAKAQLDAGFFARPDRFQVIYNGVDLTLFTPAPLPPEGPPVIGTAGVLRYRYRLETFFEMSRRLAAPHRLLVVGSLDRECAVLLERYRADPQIGPRLVYQPHLPAGQLPALYRQMRLLVHPVSGDACPNVVIEALACGVPVVAPRFGGTSEVAGEAGVIFDSEPWVYDEAFVAALTAAAATALNSAGDLAPLARRRAEAGFDIERMVDRYLQSLDLPLLAPATHAAVRHTAPANRLRPLAARWLSRPRFYAAVALRKARQAQRRLAPPRPNPRPRIAFTLFDFHIGGIENWLYRLASALQGEFDFYFLATRVPGCLPKFQSVGTCAYLPGPGQMISYLQKHNIDLVQVHNERWPIDAALAAGVPHIIERLGGQRSWRRVPKYGLDLVIASAHQAVQAVADLLPPERVRLIYNGIDLDEVDATPPARLFPADTFVVGRASRFGRGQNLGLLIQAVARLAPRLPHLRLALVGGDSPMPGAEPVAEELRRQAAALGLDELVFFTGLVEHPLPLVAGFDVGTCVSNSEGLPNSLLEAMAFAKPVVSTQVGAVSELVEDGANGLLVSPGDLDALCAAIARLAGDPALCRRLGDAGRRTVAARFSLARAARQYAAVYHELMSARPGAAGAHP